MPLPAGNSWCFGSCQFVAPKPASRCKASRLNACDPNHRRRRFTRACWMSGLGIDCDRGEKRRHLDAGGCGPLGRIPGACLSGAGALPFMLPNDDRGLRFGNDRGASLLPDAAFYCRSSRADRGDQPSHRLVTDDGCSQSTGPFSRRSSGTKPL